jgi:5-formyltetrahydrofolate cyclo-ligase
MDSQDLLVFRSALRSALINKRLEVGVSERTALDTRIGNILSRCEPVFRHLVIGFCWPYKGEFDLRPLAMRWSSEGMAVALCALTEVGAPMRFRRWSPAVPLVPGAYGIPIPLGTELMIPDLLLIPLVGFDSQAYRLGYGGGYFDRFLSELQVKPITIGISYDLMRVDTIHPQPHDVPMDFIVTDSAMFAAGDSALERVEEGEFPSRLTGLVTVRRLPRRQPDNGSVSQLSSPVCYASEFPGYFGETPDGNSKREG